MKKLDNNGRAYYSDINSEQKIKPMVPPQRGASVGAFVLLVAVIALLLSVTARAHQVDVIIGLPDTTRHTPSCRSECNENNHLVLAAYTHDSGFGVTGGTFVNTQYDRSYVGVLHYAAYTSDVLEIRPSVGGVRGYGDLDGVPCTGGTCLTVAFDVTLWITPRIGFTRVFFGGTVQTDAAKIKVWGE
jgi:hypothetical protein